MMIKIFKIEYIQLDFGITYNLSYILPLQKTVDTKSVVNEYKLCYYEFYQVVSDKDNLHKCIIITSFFYLSNNDDMAIGLKTIVNYILNYYKVENLKKLTVENYLHEQKLVRFMSLFSILGALRLAYGQGFFLAEWAKILASSKEPLLQGFESFELPILNSIIKNYTYWCRSIIFQCIQKIEEKYNIYYSYNSKSSTRILTKEQITLLKNFFKFSPYKISTKKINFNQLLYLFLNNTIADKIPAKFQNRLRSYFEELCFYIRMYNILSIHLNSYIIWSEKRDELHEILDATKVSFTWDGVMEISNNQMSTLIVLLDYGQDEFLDKYIYHNLMTNFFIYLSEMDPKS